MKKMLVTLFFVFTAIFLSRPAEAAPQLICGQVLQVLFNAYSVAGGGTSDSISLSGYNGQNPSTGDREIGKIALLAKLTGSQVCINFDLALPLSTNNLIHLTVM